MPSFNLFRSSENNAALFEIRLENDLIVLKGSENEATSQLLKGALLLCLPSALKIESIHLRMKRQCRIRWHEQIHVHRLDGTPGFERIPLEGITLSAGNYEWPFELVVPGSMVESIEGLDDAHVKYKLKATVTRGRLFHDLHAHKPIRIIRTLGPSALAHAASMKNTWLNKVEYSLVFSQWAAVFGTSIQIEMTFTPLLKGLKVKIVKFDLMESHDWNLNFPTYGYQHWKKSQDIASWKFEEEHYQDTTNHLGRDGWVLKETVLLPRHCIQDVEFEDIKTLGIKIQHKVKFSIALKHPDGHISEICGSLPVTIGEVDHPGSGMTPGWQTPESIDYLDIDFTKSTELQILLSPARMVNSD